MYGDELMMDEELKKKEEQCNAMKTILHDFEIELQGMCEYILHLTDQSVATVQFKLGRFAKLCTQYEEAYTELIRELSSEEKVQAYRDRRTLQTRLDETHITALEYIDKKALEQPEVSGSTKSTTALKNLSITPFDGQITNWKPFEKAFTSMVVKNKAYSGEDKFHYLRMYVEGDAIALISEMPETHENFMKVWKSFLLRFNNPRRIMNEHMRAMLDCPSEPEDSHSAAPLRKIATLFEKHFSALQGFIKQDGVDLGDATWNYICSSKMNQTTRQLWEVELRKRGNAAHLVTIEELMLFIQNRSDSMEFAAQVTSSTMSELNNQIRSKSNNRGFFGDLNSSTAESGEAKKKKPSCLICQESHYANQCPLLLNSDDATRYNLVQQFRLCRNCLHPNCSVATCTRGVCRICSQKHHTLLHRSSGYLYEQGPVAFAAANASFPSMYHNAPQNVFASNPQNDTAAANAPVPPAPEYHNVPQAFASNPQNDQYYSAATNYTTAPRQHVSRSPGLTPPGLSSHPPWMH